MKLYLPRSFLIPFLVLAIAGMTQLTTTSHAQTGDWEYVEELGGYLDWDTGLVWGDHNLDVMNPAFYMGWDYTKNTYLPWYRSTTGIADWRMPTVAELQTAESHGIVDTIHILNSLIPVWSSEEYKVKGVARAAAVYLYDGSNGAVELRSKTVGAGFIPVYSLLPPPPPEPTHPGKGPK